MPIVSEGPKSHMTEIVRDLSKTYLPILLVAALLLAVGSAMYTIGGVMKDIEINRVATASRFSSLEESMKKIQTLLELKGSCK